MATTKISQFPSMSAGDADLSNDFLPIVSGSNNKKISLDILGNSITASYALFAISASHEIIQEVSSSYALSSSYAVSASHADNANTSSFINSTFISASAAASGFGPGVVGDSVWKDETTYITSSVAVQIDSTLTSSDARMGVLTIAPSAISNVQTGIKLIDSSTGASEGLKIEWSSSSDPGTAYIQGKSYDRLEFGTANTARMAITSSTTLGLYGTTRVGIGTISPTEMLQVEGNTKIIGSIDAGVDITASNAVLADTASFTDTLTVGTSPSYYPIEIDPRGGRSIAIGEDAFAAEVGGVYQYNIGIGKNAGRYLDDTANLVIGYAAAQSAVTGKYNHIIGYSSAKEASGSNYFGFNGNTTLGYQTLYSQRGSIVRGNTAIGLQSLRGDSSAYDNANPYEYNTAIGYAALQLHKSGSENTALGAFAGKASVQSYGNVFIGYNAGLVYSAASGYGNVYLGWKCADNMTDGNWNTYLGGDIAPSAVGSGVYNETVIGAQTTGIGTNTVALGNTSVSAIKGQVATSTYSDSRIKRNITSGSLGLDFINALNPVRFQRVNPAEYPEEIRPFNYFDRTKWEDIEDYPYSASYTQPADPAPPTDNSWVDGLIAQEVSSSLNGIPSDIWDQNPDGKQGIKYSVLTIPLIKAVQELSAKVTALEAQISGSE